MRQKRKVKKLNPNAQATGKYGIKMGLILAGCIFSLCSICLFTSTAGAAGGNSNEVIYSGYDDNIEVLYKVGITTTEDTNLEKEEIYLNDKAVIITPRKVIVKNQNSLNNNYSETTNKVNENVYGNILGGDYNVINSNNVTMIAGSGNIVNINNDNSTILGGESNIITGITNSTVAPPIILGGSSNEILNNSNNSVILGGNGNKIDGGIWSFILGGLNNIINTNGSGVIIGGQNVEIYNGNNMFVFSNDSATFSPSTENTFYLRLTKGLGINTTQNEKGVSSRGAVKFGNAENITCNDDNVGLQGNIEGCLVGCTSKSASSGIWELINYSEKCQKMCSGSNICMHTPYEIIEKNNGYNAECSSTEFDNAHRCFPTINYGNVVFESSLIDSEDRCPDDKENRCVYKCNKNAHLLEDKTGRVGGTTGCYLDCELPYDSDTKIRHNEKVMGYVNSSITCTDTCKDSSNYKEFVCSNGKRYERHDSYGGYAGNEIENFYETCNLNDYNCNSDFNLLTGDTNKKRGSYKSCNNYNANTAQDSCTIQYPTYYKLMGCNKSNGYFEYNDNGKLKCMEACIIDGTTFYHDDQTVIYKNSNETCPETCVGVTVRCNDGTIEEKIGEIWRNSNGKYKDYHLDCSLDSRDTCDDYGIDETDEGKENFGENTSYEGCTIYTAFGNDTCSPETKYKIIGCASGHHAETGTYNYCIPNYDGGYYCNQKGKPSNSDYTGTDVEITLEWHGSRYDGRRDLVPNCDWECIKGYHKNGNGCELNTKLNQSPKKNCTVPEGGDPENGYYYTGTTTSTRIWDFNKGQYVGDFCGVKCNTGYKLEKGACVAESTT